MFFVRAKIPKNQLLEVPLVYAYKKPGATPPPNSKGYILGFEASSTNLRCEMLCTR